MERNVPLLPLLVQRSVRGEHGPLRKLVEPRDNPGLPVIVAFLARHANRQGLELDEGVGDVDHLIPGRRRDPKPSVVFENDQAFGGQAHQRFTKRAQPGPITLAEIAKHQPGAGIQSIVQDIRANLLEKVRGERARAAAARIGAPPSMHRRACTDRLGHKPL